MNKVEGAAKLLTQIQRTTLRNANGFLRLIQRAIRSASFESRIILKRVYRVGHELFQYIRNHKEQIIIRLRSIGHGVSFHWSNRWPVVPAWLWLNYKIIYSVRWLSQRPTSEGTQTAWTLCHPHAQSKYLNDLKSGGCKSFANISCQGWDLSNCTCLNTLLKTYGQSEA